MPKHGLTQNVPAKLFLKYEIGSVPKLPHCNVENCTSYPVLFYFVCFFSFKLMQFAGSEIKMKNFTNPGLD